MVVVVVVLVVADGDDGVAVVHGVLHDWRQHLHSLDQSITTTEGLRPSPAQFPRRRGQRREATQFSTFTFPAAPWTLAGEPWEPIRGARVADAGRALAWAAAGGGRRRSLLRVTCARATLLPSRGAPPQLRTLSRRSQRSRPRDVQQRPRPRETGTAEEIWLLVFCSQKLRENLTFHF